MAYLNVVRVEEALESLKQRFETFVPETEIVSLHSALNRIISEDLTSNEHLPAFRRSMVDGYAIIANDSYGASEQAPMLLSCVGQVEMGKPATGKVTPGQAIYVPTGGEIPEGADAMIMIEHTEAMDPDVALYTSVSVGEHIVAVGDDVRSGSCVLKKGTRISPHHGGLLASLGFSVLPVVKPIKVAILSTGDELVDITATPTFGEVRDCNATIIRQTVLACGAEVVLEKRVSDRLDCICEALTEAMAISDVVLLSGGSSAGMKDLTQTAIDSFGTQDESPNVFIHGLAIKPGKPTIIGQIEDKAVIGLPGHPAACFITMKALVEPFLDQLMGKNETQIRQIPCEATFQMHSASGRDVYQLVKVNYEDGKFKAHILYGKSGMVSAMAEANAYIVIPMQHEGVRKGDVLIANLL